MTLIEMRRPVLVLPAVALLAACDQLTTEEEPEESLYATHCVSHVGGYQEIDKTIEPWESIFDLQFRNGCERPVVVKVSARLFDMVYGRSGGGYDRVRYSVQINPGGTLWLCNDPNGIIKECRFAQSLGERFRFNWTACFFPADDQRCPWRDFPD